jgi:hypothetical protein
MLQRIQTLWLLLAGAAALLTLKLPSYAITKPSGDELTGLNSGFAILLTTVIVTGVALVSIGLFKNRPLQLKICFAGVLLEALLIFLYYRQTIPAIKGTPSVYSILHICIIISFVLAARGINKDEKLIKESDRLR